MMRCSRLNAATQRPRSETSLRGSVRDMNITKCVSCCLQLTLGRREPPVRHAVHVRSPLEPRGQEDLGRVNAVASQLDLHRA
eukprot:4715978-Pyramimonas_sp.AAC.1